MNEHIIKVVPQRGFEAIQPLWEIVQGKGFIAGSYAAYMVGGFEFTPGDVDVFATSGENADSIFWGCSEYLGLDYVGRSSIARNLLPLSTSKIQLPVQIISPNPTWVNFPDDIVQSFDMDVCRAILISPAELMCDENIGLGKAKFLKINDPLRSLKRALKYHKRGFDFDDWELIKLLQAWDQLDADRKSSVISTARTECFEGEYEGDDDYDDDNDNEYWGGCYSIHDDYFDGE